MVLNGNIMDTNRPSSAVSADEALEKLKAILLKPDQQRIRLLEEEIERLRRNFENKEQFLEFLKPILSKALDEKVVESREEMARILAPVMGAAIKKQISEAQEEVVDALYPVIGATIRKSIAEAMRNLARMVNEKVDKALSFHFLFQKMKARVSGVSESELLLKETLPFRIHEIFFIHRDTGLLIRHVSGSQPLTSDDQDIIAGMLTAIRDFASNAFGSEKEQEVNEIQYNDFQIILESGRMFYLAVVTSGVPDNHFYSLLDEITIKIHKEHGQHLREFKGDTKVFENVVPMIKKLINHYDNIPAVQAEQRKPKGWVYLGITAALVAGLYFGLFYKSAPQSTPSLSKKTSYYIKPVDFEQFVLRVNEKTGTSFSVRNAPFRLLYEPEYLIIRGSVTSEKIRREIGNVAADMAAFPIILNELTIESPDAENSLIKKRIEETVLYFALGKTGLKRGHFSKLDSVVVWLKRIPFRKLVVSGFSDSTGAASTNRVISQKRAQTVVDYLVQKGIDPKKLKIEAWGSKRLAHLNAVLAGQAENRRVEFHFED